MIETTETPRKAPLTEAERLHVRLARVRTKQERNRSRRATLEGEMLAAETIRDELAKDATALLAALAVLEPESDNEGINNGS